MYKIRIFLILGVWMAVLPFLGFPYAWRDVLTTLSGVALVSLSYFLLQKNKTKETIIEKRTFDNFSENHDFEENQIENKIKIQ
ncbi:MAG: hypothetical protein AAB786_02635 [Patescibacteria group bacterium]